eukprot:12913488-Prorocentrum_lima.AAC.1
MERRRSARGGERRGGGRSERHCLRESTNNVDVTWLTASKVTPSKRWILLTNLIPKGGPCLLGPRKAGSTATTAL